MARAEEYGISVRMIQEDGEEMYEARVLELPDVRTYGGTYGEAYLTAVDVIKTTQEVFAEKGRPFPGVELPEEEYSGRITLRMSKSLHRTIAEKAVRDGVSLNQWIVEAIGCRVSLIAPFTGSVFVLRHTKQAHSDAVGYRIEPAAHLLTATDPQGAMTFIATSPRLSEFQGVVLDSAGTEKRLLA